MLDLVKMEKFQRLFCVLDPVITNIFVARENLLHLLHEAVRKSEPLLRKDFCLLRTLSQRLPYPPRKYKWMENI